MANSFTHQILKDDTQHTIIKLTGSFDGASGQEENIARIRANTLYGALDANNVPLGSALSVSNTAKPYYGLTIHRLWYDTDTGSGDVQLYWRANNQPGVLANTGTPIFFLQGNGEYDGAGNWITIKNPNVTANTNGDISICTRGQSTNSSYTLIMELRKDNAHYQRGQFNDPAAFNYGEYSLKP